MNSYESVIIINPNLDEETRNNVIKKITDLIKAEGEITKIEENGIRELAYEIHKCKKGYYAIFYFNAKADFITELERIYRITDEIIKFITVKQEKGEN